MASLVGSTVGKYRIVARLGRGGMAEVYKAYQPGLDRYVGIKVLHAHLVDDQDFISRFEREALAIGKLRHPNIVQAVDFDREGETYFMAMEYIDGPTLKDELKARQAGNQPFTLKEVSRIFTALCSAIDYAHSRNMVHRDIKPANVMINTEGQVVLTDFGIARILGSTQYTATGALSGTPAYMSPEQGQGERGDERSDIYSLGVMLYETVTGMVPYDADTPFAVIMKHISQPLPMPTKINPDIPEEVERVILKSMSKDPEDRYQNASDMAIDLRSAVGISPNESLHRVPLATVASAPKVDEIEHPTGPITSMKNTVPASGTDDVSTVWAAAGGDATTMTMRPKSQSLLPILIGGGGVVILILVGIIGYLALSSSDPVEPTPDFAVTETLIAIAAVTEESQHIQETAQAEEQIAQAAQAATAEALAPTETAVAATANAERIAATDSAQATRDSGLVSGILATAQAGTAEAATAQAVIAETATAEFIASFTATPTPEDPTDTPTPVPPTNTFTPTPSPLPALPTNTPVPTVPPNTPTPERPPISGKLAFPVDDGGGRYDLFIVSMPDGKILSEIKGARQPHFRGDGAKLLINGEGSSFGENAFEASPNGSVDRPVSDSPTDSYPSYNPDGNRVAYSNPQLALGSDGQYHSYLFVQCGIIPPAQEAEQTCKDIARFGILVPNGQVGEVQGSHPVWTSDDRIAYKGCNTWRGGGSCGIFIGVSWGNKRGGNGSDPVKIAEGTSAIPTDTKAGLIAFHSRETGDWEAYVTKVDGSGLTNISNNPGSSDGLPTISPDGQWVAFASNRSGGWAIYVVPINGGSVQKLFDMPKANPWGAGERDWTNERISWGP